MDKIYTTVIGTLLLLGVAFGAIGKKDVNSFKKERVISCGPVQVAREHSSWPGENNNGNSCSHQPVSAALAGRFKRGKTHGC
ncbi:hypothetical protein A4D02_29100 [Niastella koreensis]|uniref:Uncharacterized protein n=2 Tax=Niastella koreensis TaxID=354356 RepID=G8TRC1_NIAKG|nr:hypothetical protein [Niastella koreensis]AEW00043.1 hypothetical protein Niako_3747 [Niastella koreensis GR20-10]OQP49650.1 hypothetical protein A4D02_29100 [Niastella koreensis]